MIDASPAPPVVAWQPVRRLGRLWRSVRKAAVATALFAGGLAVADLALLALVKLWG